MTSDDRRARIALDPSSRTLATLGLVALVGLLAGPLTAPAVAHGGTDSITLTARESGCPDGRTYCFEVTSGGLSNITAGEEVKITLKNPSSNSLEHNLHIAKLSSANVGEDTPASAAFANTTNVAPGEQATFTTMVPSGSNGVYLWCDIPGHESQGMYRKVSFQAKGGDGDDSAKSSPGPGMFLGVLALAGGALSLTRRS